WEVRSGTPAGYRIERIGALPSGKIIAVLVLDSGDRKAHLFQYDPVGDEWFDLNIHGQFCYGAIAVAFDGNDIYTAFGGDPKVNYLERITLEPMPPVECLPVTWYKYPGNPVLGPTPGEWDYPYMAEPSVIFHDGKYMMWFAGDDPGYGGSTGIGYAESDDGINWVKQEHAVLRPSSGWDRGFIYNPTVVYAQGMFRMWYIGTVGNGAPRYVGYATSLDGVNWTKHPSYIFPTDGVFAPWEGAQGASYPQIGYPCVTFNDALNIYEMWYTGPYAQMGHATSPDGITWVRANKPDMDGDGYGDPIMEYGCQWEEQGIGIPSVLIGEDGQYNMWYGARASDGIDRLKYAASYDGINWDKCSDNPVFEPGDPDEWDDRSVGHPSVLLVDGVYKMWYTGVMNDSSIHSVGYAASINDFPPLNQPPVAVEDSITGGMDVPFTVDVLANDYDPDSDDQLHIAMLTQPMYGTLTYTGGENAGQQPDYGNPISPYSGRLTYKPDFGFYGSDSFTYTLSDDRGGNDVGMVDVTVNHPPTVSNVRAVRRPGTRLVDITYDLFDPDDSQLLVVVSVSDDGGQTFSIPSASFTGDVGLSVAPGAGNQIVWDADADIPGEYGNYIVRVGANDGKSADGSPVEVIPSGVFQMGDHFNEGYDYERPVHTVYTDAFYIGAYEVTNAQYATFLNAYEDIVDVGGIITDTAGNLLMRMHWTAAPPTGYSATLDYTMLEKSPEGIYRPKAGYENHPVNQVGWYGAVAYAQFYGKRLATEAEWEKAARGGLVGKRYPWGDTITANDANYAQSDIWPATSPVGSFPPNGYGIYDISGNVWEWCSDRFQLDYYSTFPIDHTWWNPQGADPLSYANFALRGGSWNNHSTGKFGLRNSHRIASGQHNTYSNTGFRCAGLNASALSGPFNFNRPPVVSSVHAERQAGTKLVNINYEVDDPDGDLLTISDIVPCYEFTVARRN
ncbi:SUMF1/EgtB/PvdO family nonheme iron enzyme, partial [Candidatus Poribacteria bacterium]